MKSILLAQRIIDVAKQNGIALRIEIMFIPTPRNLVTTGASLSLKHTRITLCIILKRANPSIKNREMLDLIINKHCPVHLKPLVIDESFLEINA